MTGRFFLLFFVNSYDHYNKIFLYYVTYESDKHLSFSLTLKTDRERERLSYFRSHLRFVKNEDFPFR